MKQRIFFVLMLTPDHKKALCEVLIRHTCRSTTSKDFSDVGLFLLESGYDSENCRILAGLQSADRDEGYLYYRRVMHETGLLNFNMAGHELLSLVGRFVSELVCEDSLDPLIALEFFKQLWRKSEFDALYYDFISIDDSIDLLSSGYSFIPGLTKENAGDYIRLACRIYVLFQDFDIPENLHSLALCQNCTALMTPKTVRGFQWRRLSYREVSVCPECQSPEIEHCDSIMGKRAYLLSRGIHIPGV